MSTIAIEKSWPRSAGAVFAGLLTNVVPAVGLDAVFHSSGVFPPQGEPMSDGLYALAASYRIAVAIGGGYVTARLAPGNPKKHVLTLAGIGIAAATAGTIAMWGVGPAWYPLSLIAIALPCSMLGGKLAKRM